MPKASIKTATSSKKTKKVPLPNKKEKQSKPLVPKTPEQTPPTKSLSAKTGSRKNSQVRAIAALLRDTFGLHAAADAVDRERLAQSWGSNDDNKVEKKSVKNFSWQWSLAVPSPLTQSPKLAISSGKSAAATTLTTDDAPSHSSRGGTSSSGESSSESGEDDHYQLNSKNNKNGTKSRSSTTAKANDAGKQDKSTLTVKSDSDSETEQDDDDATKPVALNPSIKVRPNSRKSSDTSSSSESSSNESDDDDDVGDKATLKPPNKSVSTEKSTTTRPAVAAGSSNSKRSSEDDSSSDEEEEEETKITASRKPPTKQKLAASASKTSTQRKTTTNISAEQPPSKKTKSNATTISKASSSTLHSITPDESVGNDDCDSSGSDVSDVSSVDVSSSDDEDSDSDSDSNSSSSSEEEEEENDDDEEEVQKIQAQKALLAAKAKAAATQAAMEWVPKTPQSHSSHSKGNTNGGAIQIATTPGSDGAQVLSNNGRPFQRVDSEYWGQAAEQDGMANNSYDATFGDAGYGARSSEKLLMVRGKDFQREKNKRKRTFNGFSRNGGQINTESTFSTKYVYDD